MSWGIDYSYDGNVWYTDDTFNSLWKFSTSDGTYERAGFPTKEDSLPQKIRALGNQLIINDFYEEKSAFMTQLKLPRTRPTQTSRPPCLALLLEGLTLITTETFGIQTGCSGREEH